MTTISMTADIIGFPGIANWIKTQKAKAARRAQIKTTINQLSALSNRELADMGITRGDIRGIAHGTFVRGCDVPVEVNPNLRGSV